MSVMLPQDTLCEQAERKLAVRDLDGAEGLASDALGRDPGCNWAHQVMARAALLRDDRDGARRLLERWRDLPVDGAFGGWGALAEDLGETETAVEIYTAHLAQLPDDVGSLFALAMLYADRDERGKAQGLLQRLLEAAPDHVDGMLELAQLYEDDGMLGLACELYDRALALQPGHSGALAGRELLSARLADAAQMPKARMSADDGAAALLGSLFVGRAGVYARQWVDGDGKAGYAPVREPLTDAVLQAHLRGDVTVGVYPVRADGTVRFLAIDVDIRKGALQKGRRSDRVMDALRRQAWKDARRLCAGFEALKLRPVVEDSGHKGCHVWVFFAVPMHAAHVRKFAQAFVKRFGPASADVQWEIFPKQDAVSDDQLGNLIKLPLGIHRKTGRRAVFVDLDGRALGDPVAALRGIRPVGQEAFRNAVARLVGRADGTGSTLKRADVDAQFPEFKSVLTGCAVVRALVDKAFQTGHLAHSERHVLKCVFGHFGDRGRAFLHAVIGACDDYNAKMTDYQVDRLHPHPIGCPKIRKHLPDLTETVACACRFELPDGGYPSPVLHVDSKFTEGMGRTDRPADREVVDRYVALRQQAAQVMGELAQAESAVRDLLHDRDGCLQAGAWTLELDDDNRLHVGVREV